MNFDPISYCIHRIDHLEDRMRHLEGTPQDVARVRTRLEDLEGWRQNWDGIISKWPFALWFAILIALNIAPEKTVEAAIEIAKDVF